MEDDFTINTMISSDYWNNIINLGLSDFELLNNLIKNV